MIREASLALENKLFSVNLKPFDKLWLPLLTHKASKTLSKSVAGVIKCYLYYRHLFVKKVGVPHGNVFFDETRRPAVNSNKK